MTFIEVGIRHRMAPLRMLYIVTLTYIFKVATFWKYIIYSIWKTVRANEKCLRMIFFIAVDIRHRRAQLRMLYIVTFTYIFKVKKFEMLTSEKTVEASEKY